MQHDHFLFFYFENISKNEYRFFSHSMQKYKFFNLHKIYVNIDIAKDISQM